MRRRTKGSAGFAALSMAALCVWGIHAWGREDSEFPDGYDAVQAAPDSHKVIFENALVRVLEVTVPRTAKPNRCIIIAGRVSFSIGTRAAGRRTSGITGPAALSEIRRAARSRFTRDTGPFTG